MALGALSWMEAPALAGDVAVPVPGAATATDVDRLLVELFECEGRSLVRLARLFVDDRNAAEDLVQEAFIRLARSAHRLKDADKAAAYLRSIVLNLARDHNRRGLVSLRHRLPLADERAEAEDHLVLRDDQREIIEALRDLPHRQRDCLVLRYYQELGIDDIAETLSISRNSVKTHLQRGLGRHGVPPRGHEDGVRMSVLEERLHDALWQGAQALDESPDLFARVRLSIEDDRRLRRQRRRTVALSACIAGAVTALIFAFTDNRQGELLMDWWVLELLANVLLVGVALWLGPLIKRFGKSYAADVFRANPRAGKSFIVLTDIAYYLIFFSYVLFTMSFQLKGSWGQTVGGAQLQHEVARIGGILLILGVLHGLNLIALPVMGRLLTMNRRLDQETPATPPPPGTPAGTPQA
jgi:RNA polymerase sigma factor (sigma-70 family)